MKVAFVERKLLNFSVVFYLSLFLFNFQITQQELLLPQFFFQGSAQLQGLAFCVLQFFFGVGGSLGVVATAHLGALLNGLDHGFVAFLQLYFPFLALGHLHFQKLDPLLQNCTVFLEFFLFLSQLSFHVVHYIHRVICGKVTGHALILLTQIESVETLAQACKRLVDCRKGVIKCVLRVWCCHREINVLD